MQYRVTGAILLLSALLLAQTPQEQTIRELIQTFAEARNSGDGAAVASLYSEDGEWIPSTPYGVRAKGRQALTKLWTNLPGKVRRTIQSMDFPAGQIAVVHVEMLYDDPSKGLHHEVFVLVAENGRWRIRIHQTAD